MSEGRAKRACTAKAKMPSSTHYVGYVEDDETPEAIMKKFEALERVQQAQTRGGGGGGEDEGAGGEAGPSAPIVEGGEGLTEEQLLEVFKQTSVFTVKSALAGLEYMHGGDGGGDDDEYRSEEDWEEEFDQIADFWEDDAVGADTRKRRPAARGAPAAPREAKQQKHVLTAYNRDNQMLMRRKKVVDPNEVMVIKLPPPPLPSSWGRMIKPYCPASAAATALTAVADTKHLTTPSVLALDLPKLGTDFLGVLLNPPWASVTAKQIEGLGLHKLCPSGFIFVWVEKEVLDEVVDALVRLKYVYVENLTWVLLGANNRVLQGAAPFIGRSHRTLLIFRRDVREHPQGKEIELRHQRSPDVEVQVVSTAADGRLLTPDAAYLAIETLLPGGYTAGKPGRFLELWGFAERRRPGWTHVCTPAGAC